MTQKGIEQMKPTYQNILRLKYLGNDRYNASWQGWPSEGSKRVTKRITADDHNGAAYEAAQAFMAWLETGPMGDKHKCNLETLTMGQDVTDCYMVGVTQQWTRRESI
jgi:hypothetical protein